MDHCLQNTSWSILLTFMDGFAPNWVHMDDILCVVFFFLDPSLQLLLAMTQTIV